MKKLCWDITQNMKFSVKDSAVNLTKFTFTEEIRNGKLHLLGLPGAISKRKGKIKKSYTLKSLLYCFFKKNVLKSFYGH